MKDSPAYGARNVLIVAAGTGEALPGPMTCDVVGVWGPITGDPGKWVPGRVGVGGGRSTDAGVREGCGGAGGQHNHRGGKGRCFVGARGGMEVAR